jgi:benzoylformate decarboxylase
MQRQGMKKGRTGRFAILEQFQADGMRHMFGNPGTVEQGFLDALWEYPDLKYILTLQESIAVLMADGYARATQKPTLVQLHSSPGIGNAIGALYQAKRGHSPLVVIGGDAGIQYQAMDAQMAADLVAFCEPVTKWSAMVQDPASVLRMVRRAIKIAATPPMGPVYLCLPQNILDVPTVEDVVPTSLPSTRTLPDPTLVRQMASWLASAKSPVILMGDGVAYSGAQAELTKVAEMLGAEVWGADAGEVSMAYDHPLYQGQTGHMFGFASLPVTRRGDVVLVCGTYVLPEVFPELGNVFSPDAKVIHIDLNAYEIAKNHPVSLGVVSDPKLTLAAVAKELEAAMTPAQSKAAAARADKLGKAKQAKLQADLENDRNVRDAVPMKGSRFMEELAAQLPKDAILFDEALTNSPFLTRYMPPKKTGRFFQTRGGSLGIGIPGAIGVKIAHPDKTVVGFSGDGGAMYTIQALWSAARHKVDAKFVVCNNGSYKLLQLNIQQYWKETGVKPHKFPLSFDLSYPPIRFDELAKSMGVEAVRVERPADVGPAIKRMLAHNGPFLIDLVLEGVVDPKAVSVVCCGQ